MGRIELKIGKFRNTKKFRQKNGEFKKFRKLINSIKFMNKKI